MITGDTVMLDYGDGDTGYTAIILELGVIPDTEPRAVAYTACPRYVGLPGALLDWNEIAGGDLKTCPDLGWVPISHLRVIES